MKWTNPLSNDTSWSTPVTNKSQKELAAKNVAERLRQNDIIGVGSGSTSFLALLALVKRRDTENLWFSVITTSLEMDLLCASLSVPVTKLSVQRPDWSFDGADEVDENNNLIKGRGGALLREKLLIAASPEAYIIIDPTKRVKRLGQKFPVPVEIIPEAIHLVERLLRENKDIRSIELRKSHGKDGPVITENGNLLLDVTFDMILPDTELRLKSMTGIVETGLFIGYPIKIINYL